MALTLILKLFVIMTLSTLIFDIAYRIYFKVKHGYKLEVSDIEPVEEIEEQEIQDVINKMTFLIREHLNNNKVLK